MHGRNLATLIVTLAGLSLLGCERSPGAKAEAEYAALREEHRADKLLERGRAFAMVGDLTRAEEYLASAIDEGADRHVVLPMLIDVCVRGGRYRSAIQYAEAQLRKQPRDQGTRLILGTLHYAIGDTHEARAELEELLEQRPNEARAHYVLAIMARDNDNDVVSADRHFREYLRIQPNGTHAEEARASLLKRVE
jgi:tetratricopeptide (TPR) repeat protein